MVLTENFNLVCLAWIILALVLFPVLLKVRQPYGKHVSGNWGPMISNRWGWFTMELPALLVFCYFAATGFDSLNRLFLIAGGLWCLHYVHRAVLFPFLIRTSGKKMPLLIVLFAILFNTVNGFLNGYWLARYSASAPELPLEGWRLAAGSILFITGFAINKYHDTLLIRLRKEHPGGYRVPFKGLFRYVSCPNYLGEIIAWSGYLVVTLSLPALSFLVWTLVNLVPRALDNHRWYREQFPDYPAERKALFPGLL